MNIYLVRHGKVNNPKNIFYGRLHGFNLLQEKVNEIEETGKFLKGKNIEIIISSPMERAIETAQIIKKILKLDKTNTIISSRINEIRTSFQGKPIAELEKINFDIYSSRYRSKGNETIKQIISRMEKFIISLTYKFNGKNILAVNHGYPIAIIKAYIQNKPLNMNDIYSQNYPKHGEVIKIEIIKNKILNIKSVFKP